MVKFNRSSLQSILSPADEVKITVTGKIIGGLDFVGEDVIKVILPGRIKDVASAKGGGGKWWQSTHGRDLCKGEW